MQHFFLPYAFFLFFNAFLLPLFLSSLQVACLALIDQRKISFRGWIWFDYFAFLSLSGVYRRTGKDVHQMQLPQSASNNSKQQLPTGTDTGRSSSARATKKWRRAWRSILFFYFCFLYFFSSSVYSACSSFFLSISVFVVVVFFCLPYSLSLSFVFFYI